MGISSFIGNTTPGRVLRVKVKGDLKQMHALQVR